MPENAGNDWFDSFPTYIQDTLVYRLGNYTLLEEDKNRECGSKNFDDKKIIYKSSQYEMTKKIDYHVWTPNTLDFRQEKLADYATAVWRLPYYD